MSKLEETEHFHHTGFHAKQINNHTYTLYFWMIITALFLKSEDLPCFIYLSYKQYSEFNIEFPLPPLSTSFVFQKDSFPSVYSCLVSTLSLFSNKDFPPFIQHQHKFSFFSKVRLYFILLFFCYLVFCHSV